MGAARQGTDRRPAGNAGATIRTGNRGRREMERVKGIEPSYSAWKAAALPLSYTRMVFPVVRGDSPAGSRPPQTDIPVVRGDSPAGSRPPRTDIPVVRGDSPAGSRPPRTDIPIVRGDSPTGSRPPRTKARTGRNLASADRNASGAGKSPEIAYLPHLSTNGSRLRASSRRPLRVAGSRGVRGWRTKSDLITPPSIIAVLVARRPHWRFS